VEGSEGGWTEVEGGKEWEEGGEWEGCERVERRGEMEFGGRVLGG